MLKKKRRKVVDVNLKCDIANEIYHQTALIHEIKRELEFLEKLLKTPKETNENYLPLSKSHIAE